MLWAVYFNHNLTFSFTLQTFNCYAGPPRSRPGIKLYARVYMDYLHTS